jgi:phage terminase Nu1 subunit (DNA packaging protein)
VVQLQCNRNKLAKVLGRDVKTIDRMVEKGMPYVSRPDKKLGQTKWLFDTGEVLAWMIGDSSAATLKDAKTRLAQAKAGLKWLAYGQALGYLVDIEEVLRRVEGGDAIVKSRLMAIPGRLAQLVAIETDPAVVERMLEEEFAEALDQLNKNWKDRV